MSARTETSSETVQVPRAIAEKLAKFANEWDRWQAKGSTSTERMVTFRYGQARIGLSEFREVRAMLDAAPATADTEDDEGLIADAARRIASYSEGKTRGNVYKAAKQELAALRSTPQQGEVL